MKKIICLMIISLFILMQSIYAKNIAILISGGYGTIDNTTHPERLSYWRDLVLTYEFLIYEAGYTHENIYVFFGEGEDWTNTTYDNSRYNIHDENNPDYVWFSGDNAIQKIVDFSNYYNSISSGISDIINNLSNKDNILVWWVRGHGAGSKYYQDADTRYPPADCDNYSADVFPDENNSDGINESQYILCNLNPLYNLFRFQDNIGNKKYSRRKFLWATCRSGHLIVGGKTLLNDGDPTNTNDPNTTVITSCLWRELGIRREDNGVHSGFPLSVYETMMKKNQDGTTININADYNSDGVISIYELYTSITTENIFHNISWNESDLDDIGAHPQIDPQIDAPSDMSKFIYLVENLKLKGVTIESTINEPERIYWVNQIEAGKNDNNDILIIPSNSKVEFAVDEKIILKPGFWAKNGSKFHAHTGHYLTFH